MCVIFVGKNDFSREIIVRTHRISIRIVYVIVITVREAVILSVCFVNSNAYSISIY